jgi:hypothetical protein
MYGLPYFRVPREFSGLSGFLASADFGMRFVPPDGGALRRFSLASGPEHFRLPAARC